MAGQETKHFKKAKAYAHTKYLLSVADTLFIFIALLLVLVSGASSMLAGRLSLLIQQKYLLVAAYAGVLSFLYFLLNLPLNFYSSYTIEHAFELSTQKKSDWLKDQIKVSLLGYVIMVILACAFYFILSRYPRLWWLVISLFWIFFSLVLARLTPTLIIPLFFKYKKLTDQALRERILRLAKEMRVKIFDCFEIDFSKKTLKGNAALAGWGKTRRVILADTLRDKYTPDEIEVILAHEFAHSRLQHIFKLIAVNAAATVFIFYIIFLSSDAMLGVFGLASLWDIAALPVVFLYFALFGIIMQPFENFISRSFERSADRMALEVTKNKEAFISMMEKLSLQNLSDTKPHPLIKFYFFDHPPIDERIAMARAVKV